MRYIVLYSLFLLLFGCRSVDRQAVNSYVDSGKVSIQGSVSYKGSGLFPKKQTYWIRKIDGEPVKEPGHSKAFPLSPGVHSIVVGGFLFQGHMGEHETLVGEAALSLDGKAGHIYEVRGDVGAQQLAIYIFDITENRTATEPVKAAVHATTHNDPIFVPIPVL